MGLRLQIILMGLLCSVPASAQSWESLQGLKAGDRIEVRDSGGVEQRGKFTSASADAITFEGGKGPVSFERARVKQVRVRSTAKRVRNIVIGAVIGVAVGAIIDQTLGAHARNETGESSGARAVTYMAPIGLFAGLGAIPAYRTVYRAK